MSKRIANFNCEFWGDNMPNVKGRYTIDQKAFDNINAKLCLELSNYLGIKDIKPLVLYDSEEYKLNVKYSRIHNKFFGRMNGSDEDSDFRPFTIEFVEELVIPKNKYFEFFMAYKYEPGVTVYMNMFSWIENDNVHDIKDDFNIMNRNID